MKHKQKRRKRVVPQPFDYWAKWSPDKVPGLVYWLDARRLEYFTPEEERANAKVYTHKYPMPPVNPASPFKSLNVRYEKGHWVVDGVAKPGRKQEAINLLRTLHTVDTLCYNVSVGKRLGGSKARA